MSVSMGTVLGASVVVSSPLIFQVFHDSLGEAVAFQRWVVCAVVCWVALSLVDMLVSTGKASPRTQAETVPEDPVTQDVGAPRS